MSRIRSSPGPRSFRIDVFERGNDECVHGTAWFAAPNKVVTARHVAQPGGAVSLWRLHLSKEDIVEIKENSQQIQCDEEHDLAMLTIDEHRPELVIELGPIPNAQALWSAPSFPSKDSRELRVPMGKVGLNNGEKADQRIHLFVNQGTEVSWGGCSGAPILVDGKAVGVFTREDNGSRSTAFAATVECIRPWLASGPVTETEAPILKWCRTRLAVSTVSSIFILIMMLILMFSVGIVYFGQQVQDDYYGRCTENEMLAPIANINMHTAMKDWRSAVGEIRAVRIQFECNTAVVPDVAHQLIADIATLVIRYDLKLSIYGHVDERNEFDYSMALGNRYSAEVKTILVSHGVNSSNISAFSHGEARPRATGSSDEMVWALNRWVDFEVKRLYAPAQINISTDLGTRYTIVGNNSNKHLRSGDDIVPGLQYTLTVKSGEEICIYDNSIALKDGDILNVDCHYCICNMHIHNVFD